MEMWVNNVKKCNTSFLRFGFRKYINAYKSMEVCRALANFGKRFALALISSSTRLKTDLDTNGGRSPSSCTVMAHLL